MIYVFDIDGTLFDTPPGNEYEKAEPIESMIALVNMLYDEGHTIKIFTARGSSSGINHFELTKKQLEKFGVQYHELIMGKPSAHYFIDDMSLTPEEFLNVI